MVWSELHGRPVRGRKVGARRHGRREGRKRKRNREWLGIYITCWCPQKNFLEMIPFLAIFLQKCQDTDIEKTTSWGCGW